MLFFKYTLLWLSVKACSPLWGQCGGIGWSGPTCCDVGTCQSWYMQCIPGTPAPTFAPTTLSPTTPAPPTTASPTPTLSTYCPSRNDLIVAYGNSMLQNQGWTTQGGGGVATKTAFNLLGGSVEYDVILNETLVGVNANVYTLSPKNVPLSGFTQQQYCDGSRSGDQWCAELDFLESNGNCGGASTVHTLEGSGPGSCNAWGCQATFLYSGKPNFHMKIAIATTGQVTMYRDQAAILNYSPVPQPSDWSILKNAYQTKGAVIYSSQWVGWVPLTDKCSGSGDLGQSIMSIRNLRITGTVVQGPVPTLCTIQ